MQAPKRQAPRLPSTPLVLSHSGPVLSPSGPVTDASPPPPDTSDGASGVGGDVGGGVGGGRGGILHHEDSGSPEESEGRPLYLLPDYPGLTDPPEPSRTPAGLTDSPGLSSAGSPGGSGGANADAWELNRFAGNISRFFVCISASTFFDSSNSTSV
ncbi:hypothetical protein T492DRAFT_128788 [Pavlovales sp. CCMP2436]|nr:hypothetical protein T492DRAFT_128788 [Pavlovales sp. CCMP2436]